MYNFKISKQTSNHFNQVTEGETIEQKVRRIRTNKEPITDTTEMIYTERKEGVLPKYNIRTDRFEIAIDAMDRVSKSKRAKREEKQHLS